MRTARLAAAALAVAALAGPAAADPPGGGPCHVYWQDPVFDHGIDGVPPVPGRPYVICDR